MSAEINSDSDFDNVFKRLNDRFRIDRRDFLKVSAGTAVGLTGILLAEELGLNFKEIHGEELNTDIFPPPIPFTDNELASYNNIVKKLAPTNTSTPPLTPTAISPDGSIDGLPRPEIGSAYDEYLHRESPKPFELAKNSKGETWSVSGTKTVQQFIEKIGIDKIGFGFVDRGKQLRSIVLFTNEDVTIGMTVIRKDTNYQPEFQPVRYPKNTLFVIDPKTGTISQSLQVDNGIAQDMAIVEGNDPVRQAFKQYNITVPDQKDGINPLVLLKLRKNQKNQDEIAGVVVQGTYANFGGYHVQIPPESILFRLNAPEVEATTPYEKLSTYHFKKGDVFSLRKKANADKISKIFDWSVTRNGVEYLHHAPIIDLAPFGNIRPLGYEGKEMALSNGTTVIRGTFIYAGYEINTRVINGNPVRFLEVLGGIVDQTSKKTKVLRLATDMSQKNGTMYYSPTGGSDFPASMADVMKGLDTCHPGAQMVMISNVYKNTSDTNDVYGNTEFMTDPLAIRDWQFSGKEQGLVTLDDGSVFVNSSEYQLSEHATSTEYSSYTGK